MTDNEIEDLIREAQAAGPLTAAEFQEETAAIRAYARELAASAWQAGIESGSAGPLDMDAIKNVAREGQAGPGGS